MAKPKKINSSLKPSYLVAGISIAIAVFMGVSATGGKVEASQTSVNTTMIPVPLTTVPRGTSLSDIEFTMVEYPKDATLPGLVTDKTSLQALRATSTLPKLQPVSRSLVVTDLGERNPVVGKIPAGMRAISVRVDAESAVEGWASSGNYVDVIVIKPSATKADGLEAKVIAENVQILSAGRSTKGAKGGSTAPSTPGTVTLLTTQEAALRIKTAQQIGKLTFALRGATDSLPVVANTLGKEDFLFTNPTDGEDSDTYLGTAIDEQGNKFGLHERFGWVQLEKAPSLEEETTLAEVE